MTVTATDTPNYSASHQKAQPLGKLYKNTRLTVEHWEYLVTKRGLPFDWVMDNCESMTAKTATEYLGYTAPSNGIMIRGENGQYSFKPDIPLVEYKDGKEKVRKYLTPREDEGYDAMLLTHPMYSDYWTNLDKLKERAYIIDGAPCIAVTEGGFKAMVVMDNKIPCVAALGVEMGLTPKKNDPQGKRYLVKTLEKLARAGFGFLMMFDGDIATNINVTNALKKLGHQLGLFNVHVHVASWDMTSEKDKGVDDYILNNGFPQFQSEVLSRVQPFAEWLERIEQQFKKEGTHKGKPTPQTIAKEIAEEYQPNWRFSDKEQVWRFWNGKYWEKKSGSYVETSVKAILDSREIEYRRSAFVTDVVKLIKMDLTTFKWETFDRSKYIAFDNGVLEVETKKLLPHSQGYGFVSVLPYEYNPLKPIGEYQSVIEALKTECPATHQFMLTAMKGDEIGVKKLLAVINSVITFNLSKLQMFVHFCGLPGTGKGTMTRLIQKCVGKNNYKGSTIKNLSKPDEIANIIDKQLVVLPDERTDILADVILGLTGNDEMSYRQVFKEGASGVFLGSIVVSSNTPLFAGETTGMDRRTCMISFNNAIPDNKRDGSIEDLMDREIAQLIAVSLMLSDSEVTALIRGIGGADVPAFELHKWRLKLQADSVASFFNELIVIDPDGSISGSDLYKGSYRGYCEENGLKPLANNKFPERFSELLRVLGIDIEKKSKANRVTWYGIRLRLESEETLTYEEQLEEQVKRSEENRQHANASPGNTRSDTSSVPDDVPAQSQTERESLPALPALEVDNINIKSEPTQPQKVGRKGQGHHPFKVKDRVTYYDKTTEGLMDATVVEVQFPPNDKNRGEYIIQFKSEYKITVFGNEINLKS
ncbi:conserved hypothetical protein [Planktothrix sp. PCC 11201]|nr:conserved hypothetical protein [Planktothrix sp. PCC 11201]